MTSNDDSTSTLARISSTALRAATGRDWDEWLAALDAAGAADWDHKAIVAHLERNHPAVESGWWRQSITVGYEQARGKRVVGQTADAGFEIGVQRSVPVPAPRLWQLIAARPELWLGEGAALALRGGARYEVPPRADAPGAHGEVRVVKPGQRVRMTWQPEGWAEPARLQLTLTPSGTDRTTLRAHLEKLPDADAREAMRARWRDALARLAAAAT